MCAELANRGVSDVLIVCCDGLTGLPEAIEATWPQATVQTCVVHLIRASMRFVSYGDRKKVAAALKPIYTAPSQEAAWQALTDCSESDLGVKYPQTVTTWTAGGFSDSACFVLQAAFFRSRKSLSASFGVRYPRAE